MTEIEQLKAEIELLKSANSQLKNQNTELNAEFQKSKALNAYYEEQFKLNRAKKFGASSEQMQYQMDFEQLNFFNEVEVENDKNPIVSEPNEETILVKRKKKNKRGANLGNLPVEVVEYKLEDENCPKCDENLHVMTKQVRKELKIIPAEVKVIEHVTYVYSCRNCEKNDIKATILKANSPKALIEKSFVSPSLMSHIMYQKYVNSMPLDRQEKDFKRFGVKLPKQNLSNWVIKGAKMLEPLQNELKNQLLKREVLHADETTLEVLHEPGREPQTKSYMWLYRTSGDTQKHIVLYDYTQGRTGKFAKDYLANFKGYLHTDGYAGYHCLEPEITLCGCFSHLRRKFEEALKVVSENKKSTSLELIGLNFINKLFEIDKKSENSDEKLEIRENQSKSIFDNFYIFIEQNHNKILPQSLIGKAFTYAINQKKYLQNFLIDGRIELSNNRAERSIKPFVIGRKNWLFCNTPKGATSSATIYSIIETAKENGLNPYKYLNFIFEQIQNGNENIEDFLPWSDNLPLQIKNVNE